MAKDDIATPTGAEPVVEAPLVAEPVVEEAPVLERDQIMNDIAKRRSEERDAELVEMGLPLANDPVDPVPAAEENPAPQLAVIDPEPAPAIQPEFVPLKVAGRTVYKTQQEIDDAGGTTAIQKSLAGDIKMQDAATKERLNSQRDLDLQERERKLDEREKAPAPAQPKLPDTAPAPDLRALAAEIVVGDVDKVAESLGKLVTQQAPPAAPAQPVDTTAIANQAAAITTRQVAVQTAQTDFARDYADINEHEGKRKLANEHTKILMRDNPNWTPSQVLTEAGNRTRGDLRVATPAPPTVAVDPLTAKQHRKAATVDALPQASARKVNQPIEHKPKTQREIFEQMEASRSH